MKAFIKILLLILAVGCIYIGFDRINNTYETAEQRYNEYISELPTDDGISAYIPSNVEEHYMSTNIKEIITVYVCVLSFGLLLLLILVVDFIKWVNSWKKDED